jgi:hypothetical protein
MLGYKISRLEYGEKLEEDDADVLVAATKILVVEDKRVRAWIDSILNIRR